MNPFIGVCLAMSLERVTDIKTSHTWVVDCHEVGSFIPQLVSSMRLSHLVSEVL